MEDLLKEETYSFVSPRDKKFIIAFDAEMDRLGYTSNQTIGDGYCWGRKMIIYTKAGVKSKKSYARIYLRENDLKLIDLIRIYFQDTAAKGITARNQLIEIATASLSDLMKEHPEHRAEAKQDLQLLNAQKMGEHEAEIEKIKNVFLAILRDIKKDIDNGEQPGEAVTAAMFQAMRDALAEQKQNPLSIDDVAAMVAGQIGQLTPMDEETADLFKQLAKKMMKGIE